MNHSDALEAMFFIGVIGFAISCFYVLFSCDDAEPDEKKRIKRISKLVALAWMLIWMGPPLINIWLKGVLG